MSIQDLLGLPSDVTQPNAYQLFGLELGESDQATINAAIARRISALKKAKSEAQPETWKRAAVAVQAAQKTLKDPTAKAELDASFGIINDPAPVAPSAAQSAVDPLASLLPPSASSPASPRAGNRVATPPIPNADTTSVEPSFARTSVAVAPSVAPAAPIADPAESIPHVATSLASPAVAPVVRQRQPVRRRKSSGGLIFGTLVLLLLTAIVGGMGYFFWFGPGEVQFVKTDQGFRIKTGGREGSASMVAPPRVESMADSRPSNDGVMKTPAPVAVDDRKSLGGEMSQSMPSGQLGVSGGAGMVPDAVPGMGMSTDSNLTTEPRMPVPSEPPVPTPPPAKPPVSQTSKPPTEAEISVGQLAIKTAVDAIRSPNWDTMKSLAEMAETKAVTPEQKQQAETVYQYADLATYYRGGIRKALAELPANSEISITDTRKVLVNEADEDHLKINLGKGADGKPNYKNYHSDALPLVLAHELASYKIDVSSPEGQAAKAAFQAIASLATPGHREESVKILRGLNQVEGADPKRLADFIEALGQ